MEIEIIPGVTAALAAAALLGAPLMRDFAVINLSDLLVPWEKIEYKVRKCLEADLVIVLYSLCSRKKENLEKVFDLVRKVRGDNVLVGVVKNAMRDGQLVKIVPLKNLNIEDIDMNMTIVIGCSKTYLLGKYMITERGYRERVRRM